MAAADTARLVASLTLDAKGFNAGVQNATRSLGKLEGTVGAIGSKASQGLKSFGRNVGLIGLGVAGGIAVAVKGGLQDLATLESAITSVDGAIQQLNLTGQISGQEIAGWANDIERDIGAAFDDKEITAAAATLLRFGKVTPKNLKQSLVVMTDLATKTGDVESAAKTLARALADPAKAAGVLKKAGVVLTKAQQDTIKAMVEQNDVAGAQQLILDELAKTTAGAAASSQGKYQRSISLLNDVAEDARKALAEGFLPVIEKVADKLSRAVGDPKFINGLREFGTQLAGGLDDLISVAEKLPWATIGDSLKLAGAGAKAVLEAFTSLPPWVQTAVLTGWGLNKLTGGALSGIVGELGKGLIKGVLGIQAAQVNITAANVTGVGGVPGAGTTPAAGSGTLGKIVKGALAVTVVGVTAEAAFQMSGLFDPRNRDTQGNVARTTNDPLQRIANLESAQKVLLERAAGGDSDARRKLDAVNAELAKLRSAQADGTRISQQAAFAIRDKVVAGTSIVTGAVNAAKTVAAQTTSAARAAGQQTAAAIRDKDLSVDVRSVVNVSTSVSVKSTIGATQKVNKYTTIL